MGVVLNTKEKTQAKFLLTKQHKMSSKINCESGMSRL